MEATIRRRSTTAKCFHYTGNISDLANWLESLGIVIPLTGCITLPNVDYTKTLREGDWVVFCWGYFNIYSAKEFHNTFKILGGVLVGYSEGRVDTIRAKEPCH